MLQEFMQRYIEALEDDFAFPEALGVFFEFQKFFAADIASGELTREEQNACVDMYLSFNQVFGILDLDTFEEEADIPAEIIVLAQERQEAKDAKNFAQADEIRTKLARLGYVVRDTKEGSVVERI